MADEALHYPAGAEPEAPAPEAPKEEPEPEEAAAPEEEAPEADKPEEKPEEKKEDEPAPEVPLQKKRSIYDDLKDTRKELKDAKARLKELEGGDKPAEKPNEEAPADDLDAYAKENGLDVKALGRLAEIIAKRVPQGQLSETERKELADLKIWQSGQLAKEQRATEDQEVLATAPAVKTQLDIHDDAELATVMAEIVKLSHTPEFHDKEVDYIVWKNRAALSKLVSPKKPSFESGGSPAQAAPDAEPDFSAGTGITPAMAEKAAYSKGGNSLEIRRGK